MAIVTYILGNCPECGAKDSFGNVDIRETYVLRGCTCCKHLKTMNLPNIKKKILYLDQFFFSSAFQDNDERFREAANRITRLTSLQLLAVPFSNIHEDETHQWKKRSQLFKFIKTIARGKTFKPASEVERTQIVNSFKKWLSDREDAQYMVERREAIDNKIHTWDSYFWIDIGRRYNTGDIQLIRNTKQETTENLITLFNEWRTEPSSFEKDLQAEYAAAEKMYFDFYFDFRTHIAQGDWDAPIAAMIIFNMLYHMCDRIPITEKLRKCAEYFNSNHFKETPYQWLNAHIFSTLKTNVRNGEHKNSKRAFEKFRGFFADVKHIATHTPYVDAFIIDQAMATLVAKPTVALEKRYGTKIFSLNNWDKLFIWLDEIELTGMTQEHKSGLRAAYPKLIF